MSDAVKRKISWDEFDKDTRDLADMLHRTGELRGVVGIARGGLVATAIIANALNIRNVKSLAVTSYHGYQQMTAEVFGSVDAIKDGEGWVFIDDLVDTGQTAKLIKKRYPKSKLAVVYAKPEGKADADFYRHVIDQDLWLVFPWEN
jgi:xanthine phosphoribosyltransferase